VEEIMRIDGLDNIEIPTSINISPAVETNISGALYKEKVANYLVGTAFQRFFTNSITNSKYYNEEVLKNAVHILNGISVDLDIMKPRLLETGLESVAYNINRKILTCCFLNLENLI
jgi:phenylalanyl-tRNA synthetase beta chain